MVLFVLSCILGLSAAIAFIVSFSLKRPADDATTPPRRKHARRTVRLAGAGLLVLGLLCLFFSLFTTVGTKNVAVLTVAGKPVGYLENGFHWKAPWEKPHELNDAVQTDTYASETYEGDQQGGATDTCIHVRIARQATACVNVSIRWQIRPSGVDYLYRNFKSNNHIQDNVVLRDLQQAMNEAFVLYDPLGIDANGLSTNPPLNVLGDRVLRQMRSEIGQWIDVQSVIIPLLNFDSDTQKRINQLQTQVAQTRVAQQAEQTAKAQAAANRALATSVSHDPNVLVSKCLDILQEAVNRGLQLPAGFSCFGTSNASIAVK